MPDSLPHHPEMDELPRKRENKSALDDMFIRSMAYRKSKPYKEMLKFIAKFPLYSPYNRFILYIQNPNITFVAMPEQWEREFGRKVKPNARPMVILVPFGPVGFVYDLADTEGDPIPEHLANPFSVQGTFQAKIWHNTLHNSIRDRIAVINQTQSALKAGEIAPFDSSKHRELVKPLGYPVEYVVALNQEHDLAMRYATLAHELGHLYSGHLGGSEYGEWKERVHLSHEQIEIEAESISFLVCSRLGLETKSHEYLAQFASKYDALPPFSLETVLKVAGRIEEMGERILPERKKKSG
jgi:hypothetical protein